MESRAQGRDVWNRAAGRGARANGRDLKVRDIMSENVITAAPGDTIAAAAKRMSEAGISCLIVIDGDRVTGILTEKDVVRLVARSSDDFRRITVSQVMSTPAQSVSPALSVVTAGRIMQARQIKRVPVLEGPRLVGVISQTDILKAIQAKLERMDDQPG